MAGEKESSKGVTAESIEDGYLAAAAAEGCWRWVVLAASFFTMLLNAAVSYNVGVLNVAMLDSFDVGVETVSWLMAVYSAMFAITGPVASAVINASDCRTCVFFSGLLTCLGMMASSFVTTPVWFFFTLSIVGLGQSMAQVGGSVGLAYYFPTRTVFASGIALSGNGLGSFLHPALFQVLLEEYSLPGAFLILGAVCLHSSICGLLMRPTAFETNRRSQRAKAEKRSFFLNVKSLWQEHSEILTDCNFFTFLLSVFLFALAFNTTLVFYPECLIKSKGYTHMEAASIASFVGIGSLVARALVGFAATETNIGEKLMYIGMNFVSFFMCMAAHTLMNFTAGALAVSFAYGLYVCPCVILFFTLTFYVLGQDKGASGYGILLLVYGLASLLGPPLYASALQIFGCTVLFKISGLLFLSAALISIRLHHHDTPQDGACGDDGIVAESHSAAIFGSRNFEYIVTVKEMEKDSGHRDCCLEGSQELHSTPVCAEHKTSSVDPKDTEPEKRSLLSLHGHPTEMI